MENHNYHHYEEQKIEEQKNFDKHAGHHAAMFLEKFWVNFVLTVIVLAFTLPGLVSPFSGSKYIPLILGSIIFFYGGWVFIKGAKKELSARLPGMMTLISLAISTAYLYSVFAVLSGRGRDLLWELATLITVMLLGHYFEMKAIAGASGALREISKLLPDTAEIIRGDKMEIIPLSELKIGDAVLVRPGGKIPADGVVIDGKSDVNEAMITGESKPTAKIKGNEVIAGTINGDGALRIKVSKIGENTYLFGVMRLVAEAQKSKSRMQVLADKAAFYLTIIAIVSGVLTFVSWLALKQEFSFALERLVAVLVIACPHALGLAVPLVVSISTSIAAKSGLLIKDRKALESARNINTILFDKTGTLTKGEYGVFKVIPAEKFIENQVLQLAASADANSEHFVSRAIVKEAKNRKLSLLKTKNFKRIAGKGVEATMGNSRVFVGGEAILEDIKLLKSRQLKSQLESLAEQGKTLIFVVRDKELMGVIALADLIRDESREAISELKRMGLNVAMITGDSNEVAKWAASDLRIDEYFSRVLPQEKAGKVKTLQFRGLKVAMVGDGINDAPALTQADLGIAIGAGTNIAIESAGIILVKNDPRDIVKIIKLSRSTYRKMIQNLFWATGYNVAALPLAAGVLYVYGILLQPALSALFMSLSTAIVAVNALLLAKQGLK